MDSGFIKYLRSQLNKPNKPLAREICGSNSEAYFTGPSNPNNSTNSMNPITIVNPLEYPNWDELLLTNDQSTFFHTSAWARVLHASYKYKPLYFTSIDNGMQSKTLRIDGSGIEPDIKRG